MKATQWGVCVGGGAWSWNKGSWLHLWDRTWGRRAWWSSWLFRKLWREYCSTNTLRNRDMGRCLSFSVVCYLVKQSDMTKCPRIECLWKVFASLKVWGWSACTMKGKVLGHMQIPSAMVLWSIPSFLSAERTAHGLTRCELWGPWNAWWRLGVKIQMIFWQFNVKNA